MIDQAHRLLSYARALTPPSGWKVEVSGNTVHVIATPLPARQRNLLLLREQFEAYCPPGLMPSENTDLIAPAIGKLRNPGLTYFPLPAAGFDTTAVPAEQAAIAVEIVSPSNPENDLVGKVRDYPLMGIPLYLLIDPREGTIVLYSRPVSGVYHQKWEGKFGERVPIPAPFDFELATDGLVRYSA